MDLPLDTGWIKPSMSLTSILSRPKSSKYLLMVLFGIMIRKEKNAHEQEKPGNKWQDDGLFGILKGFDLLLLPLIASSHRS